jgi:hypothetical protein
MRLAASMTGLMAAMFSLCLATNASGATSNWMRGTDALRFADSLQRQNMIVTSMECRDSGKISLGIDSALVRVTYAPNVHGTEWVLDGWNNLPTNKKYWEKRGFHLVSYKVFTRKKTGLRLYCTLYNK